MALCYHNYQHIFDFLPPKDLYRIKGISKALFNDFYNYIYYRCASNNVQLISNDYLIEENFWPIINRQPQIVIDVIQKILSNKYFCIAGGFPTQCYLNKNPQAPSDIDIYVLGGLGEDEAKEEFKSLFQWFNNVKGLTYDEFKVGYSNCIFTINITNFPFELQFIFTKYHTLTEVLTTFDNSHNRCGMYLDKCYVCPDAKGSRDTMITYFYFLNSIKRYKKAVQLGYYIYNFTDEQNEKLITNDFLFKMPTSTKVFNSWTMIKFIKNWDHRYNLDDNYNEFNSPIDINLANYDYVKRELEIKFINDDIHITQIKNTNIPYLTIKKPVSIYMNVNLKQIEYNNLGDFNSLFDLKRHLLDITRRAHGLQKVPRDIIETNRDLIGIEQYRKLCVNKKEFLLETVEMISKSLKPQRYLTLENRINQAKKDIEELTENNIEVMYRNIFDNSMRLFMFLGYSYRDFIQLNTNNEGKSFILGDGLRYSNDKSTIIKNIEINETHRLKCIGHKRKTRAQNITNSYSFGYWHYNIQKYI